MKNLLLVLLLSSWSVSLVGQTYSTYGIPGVGRINIPSSMELQDGEYKKLARQYGQQLLDRFNLKLSENRVVFQPRGINNLDQSGLSLYARVIIETEIGQYGDYGDIREAYHPTLAELRAVSSFFRESVESNFRGTGLRLIEWYGVEEVNINGAYALKISYLRQLDDKPYVRVDMYIFENNDRSHMVTLSYRLKEADRWRPQLKKVLNSLYITRK